ncbi:MAG: hypothetical protein FWF38_00795 [Spirochaetaceae bacterium]|nr:hypothetical protein [Spirochaetaceae bacterium]
MAKKVTSKKGKPTKKVTPEIKMSEKMKKLLEKKTIDAYVDYSIKSSLTPAEKRFVTRKWLEKTGLTIQDINYTRNRHPYWKKVKMNGAAERRKTRMEKYDFSKGTHKKWEKEELLDFIDLNPKHPDFELAKIFKCSIPSIQGIRRLYNLAAKILEFEGKKKAKPAMHKLMLINEKALREMYKKMTGKKKR